MTQTSNIFILYLVVLCIIILGVPIAFYTEKYKPAIWLAYLSLAMIWVPIIIYIYITSKSKKKYSKNQLTDLVLLIGVITIPLIVVIIKSQSKINNS